MSEDFKPLETKIPQLMEEFKIPGLAIGIIKNGEIIYTKGFGKRIIHKDLPFTPRSFYGIASTSKTIAGIAIMQLVEKGKLSIDDPVDKFIPFPKGLNGEFILIKHILSHSSGIPDIQMSMNAKFLAGVQNLTSGKFDIPPLNPVVQSILTQGTESGPSFSINTKERFFENLLSTEKEARFKPGTQFMYNNDQFQCLAYIIEEVSGNTYSEYVEKNIFEPLGMTRSTFHQKDLETDNEQDYALGYIALDPRIPMQAIPYPFNGLDYANGGVVSCVEDLAKYMLCLMNGGKYNGVRILRKKTLEKMWKPLISTPPDYLTAPGGYGLSFMIETDFFEERLIQHSGNVVAYAGQFIFLPDKKSGIVIGLNSANWGAANTLSREILADFLGKSYESPHKKLKRIISQIEGSYAIHGESAKAKIKSKTKQRDAHMATLTLSNFFGDRELDLFIDDIDKLTFFAPVGTWKLKTKFFIDPNTNSVSFLFDRFIYHKKGKTN